MKNIDLFIIDVQNDFCDSHGALYVNGADQDSIRLANFIRAYSNRFKDVFITLDSHHNFDIAHPVYWVNEQGNHPDPFTVITVKDMEQGIWRTSRPEDQNHGTEYVKTLAEKGKYSLCIWPPHCLIGSWGTQVQKDVLRSLSEWEIAGLSMVHKIYKGNNPFTEHYGALEAEIPQNDDHSTALRTDLIERLKESEMILIAGQALDYCVANTVRQMVENMSRETMKKIVLLKDCCSSVDPASGLSDAFLQEMSRKGVRILNSTDLVGEI
jgi:nicotinamidase-related amidase